jgi:hypothetical protein
MEWGGRTIKVGCSPRDQRLHTGASAVQLRCWLNLHHTSSALCAHTASPSPSSMRSLPPELAIAVPAKIGGSAICNDVRGLVCPHGAWAGMAA